MESISRRKTVYIALALTHVKTDGEKDEIRSLLAWIEAHFGVEILTWAFDLTLWQPKSVDNVYEFDTNLVAKADLVIFLYLSSDGSDGRGGELEQRKALGKPMIAFAKDGVRVSKWVVHCLEKMDITLKRFRYFDEMNEPIRKILGSIK